MSYRCSRCGKRTEVTINGECVECFSESGSKVIECVNSHFVALTETQNRKSEIVNEK